MLNKQSKPEGFLMNLKSGAVSALVLAVSLAACSEDKTENMPSVSGEGQAVVAPEKGNVVESVSQDRFNKLLAYVPEGTSYLFANKKPMPEKVLDFQLMQVKQLITLSLDSFEDLEKWEKEAAKETEDNSEKLPEAADKSTADMTNEKRRKFFQAILKDISEHMSSDKLADIGIKKDGHSILYGVDQMLVSRFEITGVDAVKEMIKRAETDSGYKAQWDKCGDLECFQFDDEEMGAAIVFMKDQIAAGLYLTENKQAVLDHLANKSKPTASYSPARWDTFLAENHYKGFGDGFFDLQKTFESGSKVFLENAKKEAMERGDSFDEAAYKGCLGLARKHIANVPQMIIGITKMEEKAIDYELLFKTSPAVSTVFQGIPNQLTGLKKASNPIIDLGLNINFSKLRDGLTQYTNFLIKTAKEEKCDDVDPMQIRKAVGGLSMAMMMGASQYKSLYVSANEFEIGKNGQPEKIELFASLIADDPTSLLQLLAMTNSAFATLQVPNDGSVVKLPEGLVPPNPATGVTPSISLSRKDKVLNVMVGNDKPALEDFKTDKPTLLWSFVDTKRYYELLGTIMKTMPQQQQDEQAQKQAIEMMNAMAEYAGKVDTRIGADERGVTIDYSIRYP
jgi:hypothetical protein